MTERMTIEEIEAQFPDEWIFVIDPDVGPDLSILTGIVAAHSKDRDEVDRITLQMKPKRSAIWFNGDTPEGVILIPSMWVEDESDAPQSG